MSRVATTMGSGRRYAGPRRLEKKTPCREREGRYADRLGCERPLSSVVLFIVALMMIMPWAAAWGGVRVWRVGGSGLSWTSQSKVSVAVDLRDSKVIQPYELSAVENISEVVEWEDVSRWTSSLIAGGKGYVSDNAATKVSNLVLVDGDSTTSSGDRFKRFGANQTGVTFYFDFGASFPMSRIVLYPSPSGKDDFLKGCEISISDGRSFGKGGDPIYRLLKRIEWNPEPVVDLDFSLQLVRFIKLRILSPNPFEIAEIEAYGEGFVPEADYLSTFIDFESPVNFGRLTLKTNKMSRGAGEGAGASAVLQVRNGADDTPLIYYRVDLETQAEEEVTEQEYLKLKGREKGPVRSDTEHWSAWSNPVKMDSMGTFSFPLDFLPGPRRYLQFKIVFEGTSTEAMQIGELSVEYSPALTTSAMGEIALVGQPNPPGGIATAVVGKDTLFTYDVRAVFGAGDLSGFDGIKIETPTRPGSVRLEMGESLASVEPDSVEISDTGLIVYFPSHRITRGRNSPFRITFGTMPLLYTTTFSGWLLDTGGNLPQMILPGDASEEIQTSALTVFGLAAGKPSISLDISPVLITPNGDGQNDKAMVSYVLTQLVREAEVDVTIYNLSGAEVRALFLGRLYPGKYDAIWNGTDDRGDLVLPGIYICKVSAKTDMETSTRLKTLGVVY